MRSSYNQSHRQVNNKSFKAEYPEPCRLSAMFRGDRLEALLEERSMSQSALARAVGVSQTTIWKLIKEPSQGSKYTHRIAELLDTTAQYLMDETEDRAPRGAVADKRLAWRGAEPERDPDTVELAEVDLRYGMGGTYLDAPVEENRRSFSRAWLRMVTRANPENLFWAVGDGDSMEPTIRSGEVVLIDRSQQTPLAGDGIWACAWGDVGQIKRLRPLPDGRVELHSDNPLVPAAMAVDGELHVIGRVVAVVRRL